MRDLIRERRLREIDPEPSRFLERADLCVVLTRSLRTPARNDRAVSSVIALPTQGLSPVVPRAPSASAIAAVIAASSFTSAVYAVDACPITCARGLVWVRATSRLLRCQQVARQKGHIPLPFACLIWLAAPSWSSK